ncbi:hypothetical protein E6H36_00350 [Candidatus Bathyarchaeota archaeon]|nr:MAG: hypothetical protein E6H36_00350 [Candidatus Bathyarchaeota archaeon]
MTGSSSNGRWKWTRLLSLVMAVLVVVGVPLAMASAGSAASAVARNAAAGPATIVWGNPFAVPTIALGNGWEKVTVRGSVEPVPGKSGYYAFQSPRLVGSLHAEWTNASDKYVLDASFSGISQYEEYSHYYPIRIIPAANALEATGLEITGTLTINGKTTTLDALAALSTAIPGYSGFQGVSPSIYVVFYISSELMITIGWSQADQTIRGIFHPACSRMIHAVRLVSTASWW